MKIKACLLALTSALLVACGAVAPEDNDHRADDPTSCTTTPAPALEQPDAASIVDSCVSNVHADYACVMAQLPTVYTAIDCAGTPKQMHPESGTLIVRPDGRDGCVTTTNYKGEHLTCCAACGVGRAPCESTDGKPACCAK